MRFWEGESKDDPSIRYRKSKEDVSKKRLERRDRCDVAIVKEEMEVHREKVDHTLMDVNEGKWQD